MNQVNVSRRISERSVAGFRVVKSSTEKTVENWQYIPKDVNILQLACTSGNWFCLSTTGQLFSWGQKTECLGRQQNNAEEARNPGRVLNQIFVSIATGKNHVLALTDRGDVYSWGKNDFGQLGNGTRQPLGEPKVIESLPKPAEIVQIYAGEECSFAVSKRGQIFAWGQNTNGQLSQNNDNEFEVTPQPLVIQCPWDNVMSTKIVYGRDNASYIYHVSLGYFNDKPINTRSSNNLNPVSSSNLVDLQSGGGGGYGNTLNIKGPDPQMYTYAQTIKKMDYQIKDLQKTVEDYREKLKQKGHIFGDEKQSDDHPSDQRQIGVDKNDQILKDITQNITELTREKQDLDTKIKTIKMEIDSLEKEILVYKKEEDQLQKKEDEFNQNKKQYDFAIREIQKNKNRTNEMSARLAELSRNLMTTKEIIQSNDDLKNKAIMKQNNSEEQKNKAKSALLELERRREEISKKERMFNQIKEERKKYLKTAIFDEKKIDLEKWIIIIHSQLKQLKDSGIKEICSKQFRDIREGGIDGKQRQVELNFTGIEEIAKKSNQNIDKISKGLKEVKLNPNDPSADIVSKVVEILEDDIQCRKQINDLTVGILIQTSTRNQQFQQNLMKHESEIEEGARIEDEVQGEDYVKRTILRKYDKLKERQLDEYELLREYVQNQKVGREMHDPLYGEDRYKKTQKANKEKNKQKSGQGLFFF